MRSPATPLSRRHFLALGGAGLGAVPLLQFGAAPTRAAGPHATGAGVDFWAELRALYATRPDVVLLDNAALSVTAGPVAAAQQAVGEVRRQGFMTFLDQYGGLFGPIEARVAALLHADPEEVLLMRNATEGLATVLMGVPLEPGDEVVYTSHEYPAMVDAIHQRAEREGIVAVPAVLPVGRDVTDEALVEAFAAALSPRTRLVLMSHVSTWDGRILPVAAMTARAHAVGARVLVDGAQGVALVPTDMAAIGCDYYGASLHKWLGAPSGTGMLFVRRSLRAELFPLFGYRPEERDTKVKFYYQAGAVDESAFIAINDALDLHERIGLERQRARLLELTRYWVERCAALPGFRLLYPTREEQQAGFGSFALDSVPSAALAGWMWQRHHIHVQDKAGWHSPYTNAVRVSPGVFTTTDELDRFVAVLGEAAARPDEVTVEPMEP